MMGGFGFGWAGGWVGEKVGGWVSGWVGLGVWAGRVWAGLGGVVGGRPCRHRQQAADGRADQLPATPLHMRAHTLGVIGPCAIPFPHVPPSLLK